jgi:dolichol-phosphate mannosyltransferase
MVVAAPARATVAVGMEPRAAAATWVVVPTFNERATLPALIIRLAAALSLLAPGELRILVVDDDSPDGTGAVADGLAAADERVRVLHRARRSGLGDAYAAGFAYALAEGAATIVQMDADGSHDAADVPRLLAELGSGRADLVIGSRYVPGGATPDWPLRRRLLSRGGCAYARRVLGHDVRDLTGGFKAWSAATLAAALAEPLTVQGYGFQIELTDRAARRGARIVELPITFRDRTEGESKMGAAIVREAIVRVPRLRLERRRAGHRATATQPAAAR